MTGVAGTIATTIDARSTVDGVRRGAPSQPRRPRRGFFVRRWQVARRGRMIAPPSPELSP
jgi:hypothetical protein